jgi:hypothetical protein
VLALAVSSALDALEASSTAADPAADLSVVDPSSSAGALARGNREQAPEPTARVALARLAYPWPELFMASEAATPRGGT